jgi:hypothetical protein
MSTGVVIVIVVAVLLVAAVVAAPTLMRDTGGARLKRRFGPEYERTLRQNEGDTKATRQELSARVKRYGGIETRPVDAETAQRYGTRWNGVQARFVDEPGAAVAEADRLIGRLAAERGFPEPGTAAHFDALSVHHPHAMQGYRQAHALAEHAGAGGRRATEDLRQALVAARTLFDEMLRDAPRPSVASVAGAQAAAVEPARTPASGAEYEAGSGAGAGAGPRSEAGSESGFDENEAEAGAAEGRRAPLSGRFAALTGGTRKGR